MVGLFVKIILLLFEKNVCGIFNSIYYIFYIFGGRRNWDFLKLSSLKWIGIENFYNKIFFWNFNKKIIILYWNYLVILILGGFLRF